MTNKEFSSQPSQVELPDEMTREQIRELAERWWDLTEQEQEKTVWWLQESPKAQELSEEWEGFFRYKEKSFTEDYEPILTKSERGAIREVAEKARDDVQLSIDRREQASETMRLLSIWGDMGVPLDELEDIVSNTDWSVNELVAYLNDQFAGLDGRKYTIEFKVIPIRLRSSEMVDREVAMLTLAQPKSVQQEPK